MKKAITVIGIVGICGYIFAGTLEIRGKAELYLPPDGMRIRFCIKATDIDLMKSKDLFAQRNRTALQALEQAGVSTNEIFTSDFIMSPQYRIETHIDEEKTEDIEDASASVPVEVEASKMRIHDRKVFDGYSHSMQYEVRIGFDKERLEKIYLALVKNGVGESLSFDFFLMNPHFAQTEVRRKAVINAKSAASELCEAVGAKICGVQQICYDNGYADMAVCGSALDVASQRTEQADDAPVFPHFKVDDIRISDSVRIVWEIK